MRALAKSGQLRAEKLANRWLVDAGALERRIAHGSPDGRPFGPRKAWALLLLLSGEDAPWLSVVERSKLRAIVRVRKFEDLRTRLRRRAEVRYFAGTERATEELARSPELVRSGVSAAERHSVSLRSSRVIDGYLPRSSAERVIYRHALREVGEHGAEIVLRLADFWALDGRDVAPAAAVAVDLLDSLDERTVRAGRDLTRRLNAS